MPIELPRPSLALVVVTELALMLLALIGVAAMALLPGFSTSLATDYPEYAELRAPLLGLSIAFITLGHIAIAMVALLVHHVYRETILRPVSVLWVDALVSALVGAIVLVVTAFVVIGNGQAGNPGLALVLVATCLILVALVSVTLVLRSLLRGATRLRAELDEVV